MSALGTQLLKFPRHLGIHSGGMVLTERSVGVVVPIEHARKEKGVNRRPTASWPLGTPRS